MPIEVRRYRADVNPCRSRLRGPAVGRMTCRSDASLPSPSGPLAEDDTDLLAINGHHFTLGAGFPPVSGAPA